ncbi:MULTISPECIES: hypothetical protein [Cellulophaga]|uniref:Uncharacterized protein n=2 Tax=Cellulophaga TaxID=104264 RepID=F0REE3_CELLC|nr:MULTISPECIES: hypothetical protein [Cellulophaga]ADY29918.1 hypothetical protein Celly_2097 [Cellulophaga lytica DSM 7489]AIM60918.1 hypothetical protein IX49_10415 [Cellulophaga lytica]APU10786.1 hypothetical protein A5M85_10995 [Cellulophaga lytica]EWH15033.1 hypothetical protein KLA_00700 [Cellulophaga geojensis KL-A]MDO6853404.1 hypothetical protein [Cellulophaga lytica]
MPQLTLQLKRLGKKKVKQIPLTLDATPNNLQQLLVGCVKNQVEAFNKKRVEVNVVGFLSPAEIQEQAQSGKVDFGDLANKDLAVEQEAIDNVLLAFKDGLFVVFVDGDEVTSLDTPLQLTKDSVVAFIRMTFLVGTYW